MSPRPQLRSRLRALLKAGEQGAETYTTINPWNSRRTFAAFAYLAEQYGYRYAGLSPQHSASRAHPVFAFRRLPDAVERATRTRARYPDAPLGGPLPGLTGDRRPVPLPEARQEAELLHARIRVDLYGTSRRGRLRMLAVAVPLGVLIALAVNGSLHAGPLAVAGGIAAAWWLYLWLASVIMQRGRVRYSRMLEQAGVEWPPGRTPG
ncbi:hypothetical protein OG946_14520 [Streptomyces sp. NBC_01808]|uniref:hypothetical protein n=1 Tax=Streptomyces sp. NBC_01808 TaxID=2975947 RepID=UPI002DDA336C|nr:hypothetical protein [Streptomyces sp. NBC_01808]WSA38484.1 hypothetical protein OG946_14520 [Streptomyces sp. NBC_01808]